MKSLFEEMGGTYRSERDYLVSDIEFPKQEDNSLGKYGRLHRIFLKKHRPVRYSCLLTQRQLWNHLAEIDWLCNERMDVITDDLKKQEGVTEGLKATDRLELGTENPKIGIFIIPNTQEPIIDMDTWEWVQEIKSTAAEILQRGVKVPFLDWCTAEIATPKCTSVQLRV